MNINFIAKDNKFSPFFWTQFLGAFNDNFFKNALVVLIAYRGVQLMGLGEGSLVALAGGVFILPFFLFSPLAGQLADRYEKAKLMVWVKFFEIIVMLGAAVGFYFDSYEWLLFILFLMGTQSAFFGPLKFGIIPDLVRKESLTEANAYVEMGTFVAILLGTIIGGWSTTQVSFKFWIGLGLPFVAFVGFLISRHIPKVPLLEQAGALSLNPLPQFKELLKLSLKDRAIWNSLLAISWFWFFGAGVLSVLPTYCKSYLQVDQDVTTLFLAVFTIGIGFGSLLAEKLSFKRVELGLVPLGSLGLTLFLFDLSWLKVPVTSELMKLSDFLSFSVSWRILLDFFFMSVSGGLFIVPLQTFIQERSPRKVLARVIAANNILNAVFMVLSSLFVMLFYSFELTQAQIFLVFSLMNIAVAFYIYTVVPEFVLRFLSWVLSHVMYKITVVGEENIPKNGALVLASNHVTFVDWLLISGACKRPSRFVMYYKFFQIPVLQRLFKRAKVIPIAGRKEDEVVFKRSFELISQELKNEEVVTIFPEGRLTPDGKLSSFRPGIVHILKEDPAPVVPVILEGLWGSIFSRGRKGWRPSFSRRPVKISFYPSLAPKKFRLDGVEEFYREKLSESD